MTSSATATSGSTPARAPLLRSPLVLMAPRTDGLEAVWAVSRLSRGRVECETADGSRQVHGSDAFGFVPQGDAVLRVRLAGLAPGTSHRLRSVTIAADDGETVASEWKTFRTLDPAAPATHFVVWNDTHANDASIQALNRVTPPADFLVWNGDTCNNWDDPAALIPTLLQPGGCDISAGRPWCLVWGNHDVRGPHAYRMPGLVATPAGRPFYAFRSGPVALVCLHTGEDKPDDHPTFAGRAAFAALRAEQAAWLAEVLQTPALRDAPYRVVCCHLPLRWTDERPPDYDHDGYDRFSLSSRSAWHDALVAWRTQIIISGHTHTPTWLPSTPAWPYGQLIGGGPEPENVTWIEARADATRLGLRLRNLAGEVLHDLSLRPVA